MFDESVVFIRKKHGLHKQKTMYLYVRRLTLLSLFENTYCYG